MVLQRGTLPDPQNIANDSPRFRHDVDGQYKKREEIINHFSGIQEATVKVIQNINALHQSLELLEKQVDSVHGHVFRDNTLASKPNKINRNSVSQNRAERSAGSSIKRTDAFKTSPNNKPNTPKISTPSQNHDTVAGSTAPHNKSNQNHQPHHKSSMEELSVNSISSHSSSSFHKISVKETARIINEKNIHQNNNNTNNNNNNSNNNNSNYNETNSSSSNNSSPQINSANLTQSSHKAASRNLKYKSKSHVSNSSHSNNNNRSTITSNRKIPPTITKRHTTGNFLENQLIKGVKQFINIFSVSLVQLSSQLNNVHRQNAAEINNYHNDNKTQHNKIRDSRKKYYDDIKKFLKETSHASSRDPETKDVDIENYRKTCFEYMNYCYNFPENFKFSVAKQFFFLTNAFKIFTDLISFDNNRENLTFYKTFDQQITRLSHSKDAVTHAVVDKVQEMITSNSHEQLTKNGDFECRVFHHIKGHKSSHGGKVKIGKDTFGGMFKTDLPEAYIVFNNNFKTLRIYDGDEKHYIRAPIAGESNESAKDKTPYGKKIKELHQINEVIPDHNRKFGLTIRQKILVNPKNKELTSSDATEPTDKDYNSISLQFKCKHEFQFWSKLFSAASGNINSTIYQPTSKHSLKLSKQIVTYLSHLINCIEIFQDKNQKLRINEVGIYRTSPNKKDTNLIYNFLRDDQVLNTTNDKEFEKKAEEINRKMKEEMSGSILAGTIKFVLSKLDPPLIPYENYEEFATFLECRRNSPDNTSGVTGTASPRSNSTGTTATLGTYPTNYHNSNSVPATPNTHRVDRHESGDSLNTNPSSPISEKYGGVYCGDTNSDSTTTNTDDDHLSNECQNDTLNLEHNKDLMKMKQLIQNIPDLNQKTLIILLNHWNNVSLKSEVNKMTSVNLGICNAPSILKSGSGNHGDRSPDQELLMMRQIGECLDFLIQNSSNLTCLLLKDVVYEEDYETSYNNWKEHYLKSL